MVFQHVISKIQQNYLQALLLYVNININYHSYKKYILP